MLNPYPLVGVEWTDAHGNATREVDENSLSQFHKPIPILTYGLLLKEDSQGVTVATEDLGDGDYRGPTFIPRSLIKELWIVSKQPRRRRGVHHVPRTTQSQQSDLQLVPDPPGT